MNDLFRDVKAANLMLDTGYSEGLDAEGIGRFEAAAAPARGRRIYRVGDRAQVVMDVGETVC